MNEWEKKDLLLDTHVWLWLLFGSPRLSSKIRKRIKELTSSCWLSPISVWELGILARKSKVNIDSDVRSWVEQALRIFPLREASVTREIALLANEIDLPHWDPADRLLAATAINHDLTLVTADRHLLKAPELSTLSAK